MSKIYYGILVLCLIWGCKPGIPKDVLPPDEMEKVLFDIHVVDGYLNYQSFPDTTRKLASAYYAGVYKKFGIDSVTYTKSLSYYYQHPDKMKLMYDSIGVRLARLKEKIQKLQPVDHGYQQEPQSVPQPADSLKQKELKKKADSTKTADSLKRIKVKLDSLSKIKRPLKKKLVDTTKRGRPGMISKPKPATQKK